MLWHVEPLKPRPQTVTIEAVTATLAAKRYAADQHGPQATAVQWRRESGEDGWYLLWNGPIGFRERVGWPIHVTKMLL